MTHVHKYEPRDILAPLLGKRIRIYGDVIFCRLLKKNRTPTEYHVIIRNVTSDQTNQPFDHLHLWIQYPPLTKKDQTFLNTLASNRHPERVKFYLSLTGEVEKYCKVSTNGTKVPNYGLTKLKGIEFISRKTNRPL